MKQHWKLFVTGKVQGVYYRNSAKQIADELGVSGWVKNEADGAVCVEVEGEVDVLKQFVAWCRRGPSAAVVDYVKIEQGQLKNYSGFEIRRS
jgi:acylphosphatase